jgi:hypothetical protein
MQRTMQHATCDNGVFIQRHYKFNRLGRNAPLPRYRMSAAAGRVLPAVVSLRCTAVRRCTAARRCTAVAPPRAVAPPAAAVGRSAAARRCGTCASRARSVLHSPLRTYAPSAATVPLRVPCEYPAITPWALYTA